ncbi:hypothetical protein GCM10028813_02850 [Ramlibacter alkalitolerans]
MCAFLSSLMLVACGGGGGGDEGAPTGGSTGGTGQPAARAEGVYRGTATLDNVSTDIRMLVLENNDFVVLYGQDVGTMFLVGGFLQGAGTSNNGSFSSSDAKDFGMSPAAPVTVTASYTPRSVVTGTVNELGQSISFTAGALSASEFDYDAPANPNSIVGSWALTRLDGSAVPVTITASGAFSGVSSGCTVSGTITPRASGKNVFDVVVNSGPAPCAEPGGRATGIAITYILQGTTTRQLVLAGTNSSRTAGTVLFGQR